MPIAENDTEGRQRLDDFMSGLKRRNPDQTEFHQAVYEVAVDLIPFIQANPCLLYTSPSPRDRTRSRMPSSA